MSESPLFSLIVPYYQDHTSHTELLRILHCISQQTFKDYELLCYHDGPLLRPEPPLPDGIQLIETAQRENVWAHNLRDRGIRDAKGQWIWTMNSDNILYPNALATVAEHILDQPSIDVWSFPIWEMKYCAPKKQFLTGKFMQINSIDAMQVVVKTQIWRQEGGWRDWSFESDGRYFDRFAKVFKWKPIICDALGEHW